MVRGGGVFDQNGQKAYFCRNLGGTTYPPAVSANVIHLADGIHENTSPGTTDQPNVEFLMVPQLRTEIIRGLGDQGDKKAHFSEHTPPVNRL